MAVNKIQPEKVRGAAGIPFKPRREVARC